MIHLRIPTAALLVLASGSALLFGGRVETQERERTVWDGVFSVEQANRGRRVYGDTCAGCHLDDLSGGQGFPLRGDVFIDRWREDSLDSLFDHLNTMPMNEELAPAGPSTQLSEAVYLDLLAFVLDANGFPPGSEELTADTLGSTRLVGRNGPEPLPTATAVLIVGCVAEGPDSVWMLTDSSEPIRSRSLVETTEEELRASAALPTTDQTYQLRNLEVRGYDPVSFLGRRVQAKGELIRETGRDRVFVTALDVVGPACQG